MHYAGAFVVLFQWNFNHGFVAVLKLMHRHGVGDMTFFFPVPHQKVGKEFGGPGQNPESSMFIFHIAAFHHFFLEAKAQQLLFRQGDAFNFRNAVPVGLHTCGYFYLPAIVGVNVVNDAFHPGTFIKHHYMVSVFQFAEMNHMAMFLLSYK